MKTTFCVLSYHLISEHEEMNLTHLAFVSHHKETCNIRKTSLWQNSYLKLVFEKNGQLLTFPKCEQLFGYISIFQLQREIVQLLGKFSITGAEMTQRKAPSEISFNLAGSFRLTELFITPLATEFRHDQAPCHSCVQLRDPLCVISAHPTVVDTILEALRVSCTIPFPHP